MSVYWKDNLIATTWNVIKDDAPQVNTSYSSQRFNEVMRPTMTELNKKIALVKGVRDVVNTYHDLENYDTTTLVDGDVINVLIDETRDNGSTYYRYDGIVPLTYIGEVPPFYTKVETDVMLDGRQDRLVNQVNIKSVNGESLVGSGNITINLDLDKWFPIGTVFQSLDDTFDPAAKFGGTWERIKGRFLRQGITSKQTGGENEVTLTTSQIPSHTHTVGIHSHGVSTTVLSNASRSSFDRSETYRCVPVIRNLTSDNNDGGYDRLVLYKHEQSYSAWNNAGDTDWITTYQSSGSATGVATATVNSATMTVANNAHGGNAHENRHPYVVACIWVRTA